MHTDDGDLIGAAEAQRMLGVSRSTVTRMAQDGRLTPIYTGPGQTGAYVFRRDDVVARASREQVPA